MIILVHGPNTGLKISDNSGHIYQRPKVEQDIRLMYLLVSLSNSQNPGLLPERLLCQVLFICYLAISYKNYLICIILTTQLLSIHDSYCPFPPSSPHTTCLSQGFFFSIKRHHYHNNPYKGKHQFQIFSLISSWQEAQQCAGKNSAWERS